MMNSLKDIRKKPSSILLSLLLIFLITTLVACSPNSTSSQPPTGLVITTPTPFILFQDDFSNPASGLWNVFQSPDIVREYKDGEFRAYVDNDKDPYYYPIAFVDRTFGDVRLEVDFRKVSGADTARAHLICRRASEKNYVFGSVDFKGEAKIGTFLDDFQVIEADELGANVSSKDVNTLRLDCIGDTFTLYVNGTYAASATMDSAAEGAVGFAAGGATESQTDLRFDNFVVSPGEY